MRSAELMTQTILSDQTLIDKLKTDPADVLFAQSDAAIASIGAQDDPWIYKVAVAALGFLVLIVIGGLIYFDCHDDMEAPESLVALASTAVGALAGLLAPSSAR